MVNGTLYTWVQVMLYFLMETFSIVVGQHHRLHIYFDAIDIKCALSKFIAEDDSDSHSDSDNYETLLSMNDDGDITLEVSVSHAEADHRLAPSTIHVNKCKP